MVKKGLMMEEEKKKRKLWIEKKKPVACTSKKEDVDFLRCGPQMDKMVGQTRLQMCVPRVRVPGNPTMGMGTSSNGRGTPSVQLSPVTDWSRIPCLGLDTSKSRREAKNRTCGRSQIHDRPKTMVSGMNRINRPIHRLDRKG